MRLAPALLAGILFAAPARAATLCTLLADASSGKVMYQKGDCAKRVTPASTFKIAISLMGFDSGFLVDAHRPVLPFQAGYADWLPEWRQRIDPTSWIAYSVVWYSQQVTGALGEARFGRYVHAFGYGNEDVSGNAGRHDGLTQAWLSSSLRISPLEQVGFLARLCGRRLGISARAYDMTAQITAVGVVGDGWMVHGKTGTGSPVSADGVRDEAHGYGWFVGWAEKGARRVAFARLIQDEGGEGERSGPRARAEFLREAPTLLGR